MGIGRLVFEGLEVELVYVVWGMPAPDHSRSGKLGVMS